jgi:LIM domain
MGLVESMECCGGNRNQNSEIDVTKESVLADTSAALPPAPGTQSSTVTSIKEVGGPDGRSRIITRVVKTTTVITGAPSKKTESVVSKPTPKPYASGPGTGPSRPPLTVIPSPVSLPTKPSPAPVIVSKKLADTRKQLEHAAQSHHTAQVSHPVVPSHQVLSKADRSAATAKVASVIGGGGGLPSTSQAPSQLAELIRERKRSNSVTPKPASSSSPFTSASASAGSPKCVKCGKSAYPVESITYDKRTWHKSCFRCTSCDTTVSISAVAMIEGVLYCKPCFHRIFASTGGKYSSLTDGSDHRRASVTATTAAAAATAATTATRTPASSNTAPSSLKERMAAFNPDTLKREEEAKLAARAAELRQNRRNSDAKTMPDMDKLRAKTANSMKVMRDTMKKMQEVEDAQNLELKLETHSGSELNINNVNSFIKCTDSERHVRYALVLDHIKSHPGIKTFNAVACGLDNSFAFKLADMLRTNTSLQEINLESNHKINDKGLIAILDAMYHNSTVRVLKIQNNNSKARVVAEAAAKLINVGNADRNSTITKLPLPCNMVQHRDQIFKGTMRNTELNRQRRQSASMASL